MRVRVSRFCWDDGRTVFGQLSEKERLKEEKVGQRSKRELSERRRGPAAAALFVRSHLVPFLRAERKPKHEEDTGTIELTT